MSRISIKTTNDKHKEAPHIDLKLTENQRRIILEKYQRTDPSIEDWLWRVATNVALAELLYPKAAPRWNLFDGVRVSRKETRLGDQTTQLTFFHADLHTADERDRNFSRFLKNCEEAVRTVPEAEALVSAWAERYFGLLASWSFLPNSPTLMNAGRDIQQLAACFVIPVEDSIEGITGALQAQALIHKSGGGTGFSFEKLRPAGDPVRSTDGVASGALAFMKVFDRMTDVVKQGGNRRGANMGILPYWHPEIREFIGLKSRPGLMENFNLSVAIDSAFMDAAEKNLDVDLLHPATKKPVERVSARDLFNRIAESAWKCGDPGVIFMDKINNSASNPTPDLGPVVATNPCGEQPLLPYESCTLGSINLANFVTGPLTKGDMDWAALEKSIDLAVRFLDNIIDINNYPLADIERISKMNRRIGLGVMGFAETLVHIGLPYDSDDAVVFAERLMTFINEKALVASAELAKERGGFSNWAKSIYDPQSPHFAGDNTIPRNAARTTIAPTGTIALAAGLQGSGIEPFYGIAYTRYNANAIEALKSNRSPNLADLYFEVNPLFNAIAKDNNYFGLSEAVLWGKIEKNGKSVRGVAEIPESLQKLFGTAHDIPFPWHLKIQEAFQKHTDNAVSKTINLPNNATIDDVKEAFRMAAKMNLKGLTVYRDGSRHEQVLATSEPHKGKRTRNLAAGVSSEYYEIHTGHGPLHVHIDYDDEGPYRVFASLDPVGSEISGLAAGTGLLVSQCLELGVDYETLLKNLNSIKGDRPVGLGDHRVNSIPHAIGIALRHHLKKHGQLPGGTSQQTEWTGFAAVKSPLDDENPIELWALRQASDQCPKCFSQNVSFNSDCRGPLCHDCGFSECR